MLVLKYVLSLVLFFYISLFLVAVFNYNMKICFNNIINVLISPYMFYINNKNIVRLVKKDINKNGMNVSKKVLNKLFFRLMLYSFCVFIPFYFWAIRLKDVNEEKNNIEYLRQISTYQSEIKKELKYA